jgi:hypothetical protein
MRWSAWQTKGAQVLSGTSLALAVGCSAEPIVKEELAPMGLTGIEQVEEAAQEARRRPRYRDDEVALAAATPASTPADAPWFLRPAGQSQPGAAVEQPSQSFANVAAERPLPPAVAEPVVQPRRNPPPPPRRGNWVRAACGRG